MYRQFCKNLRHFSRIIDDGGGQACYRKRVAEALLKLADIEAYRKSKENNSMDYIETSNLIYGISRYADRYPSLKRLTWELWAYGFDIIEDKKAEKASNEVEEAAKLADLMTSTHYFE